MMGDLRGRMDMADQEIIITFLIGPALLASCLSGGPHPIYAMALWSRVASCHASCHGNVNNADSGT
jgi:hypothetical protein